MKCSKCQFDNRVEAKFCKECGSKLELVCPGCENLISPDSKFCDKCGNDLAACSDQPPKELSFEEKLEEIQRYLPGGLTEKILAQRGKIEGERKQVTVMFCDMEGYTALSEKLDSEEVYSIMDEVYELLIHNVNDYDGTVNELTGDGVMALFGAPIALEDAPQRAIRSALSVHREMTKFSDARRGGSRTALDPLKMRIGIHTGPVVVGSVGNDLRVEFKAVGDTVNLASRMESLAEPGTTYVSDETFKLTEGLFRFEAMGEREVKGKEKPVKTYRAIASSERRTRFDVNAERGLTSFVGREKELELMLDGFERVKEGRGQAFSIISEAGIGKSRLLYEFRKAVVNENAYFLEGRCLSFSQSVAYHPIIDLVKSTYNIKDTDGDQDIRDKVIKGLKVLGVNDASTLSCLLELLSVENSGIDEILMSPGARKERIIEALKHTVLKGSETQPLIMAVEDLHWIDKNSEETLRVFLESISGARVLLILTYRPDFVHTWGGKSYHSQVNLNRLANRESLAMVTHLLGTKDIENNLEEMILERTEGVPFYIEELIKSLKELKIIEMQGGRYTLTRDAVALSIPSTIKDVIMARVDSLPDEAKGVLQTGSVIEREFSYDLIEGVMGLPERELLSHLSALKDSELMYERGIFPKSTYIFKHALTQEVVYDSILTRRKKELHGKIADAIEEIHKDNLDEQYGALSEHYGISENYEKAAEYYRLAGKKAEQTASLNDAIVYAERRVGCLEKLPQMEEVEKQLIDSRTALGLYYLQLGFYVEAKDAVDPVVDLALSLGNKRRISQIYSIVGTNNCFVEEDFSKALKYLEDALKIAEELNDNLSLVMANFWIGLPLFFCCEFEKALDHFEKMLRINRAANAFWAMAQAKGHISHVINIQGKVDEGFQTSSEALRMAEESGDIFTKGATNTFHGASCYFKGFLDEAEKHLLRGSDFIEGTSLFYNSKAKWYLGGTYFDMGKYQKSCEYYNKTISILEQGGSCPSLINLNKIASTRAKVMNNEKDIDLESLNGFVVENRVVQYEGLLSRYIAEILLNVDDQHSAEAEDWIKKAIEADKRNGMMWYLGRDYLSYAELLRRKDDLPKTRENLNTAAEIFQECGADGDLKKAKTLLEELA